MSKEFWVQLKYHENDDYNELWITKDKKYFARHTYYDKGIWYFVSDPLGYCELDHMCPDDYIFHVCGPDWKELFIDTNKTGFESLRVVKNREWENARPMFEHMLFEENLSTIFLTHAITGDNPSELNQWLLTFKDPDIYGDVAKDYDENWCGCWKTEEMSRIQLGTFDYVGIELAIEKVRYRHMICGVEWSEYYCAGEYKGAFFDVKHVGTMYSRRNAIKKVADQLKEKFQNAKYLSYIENYDWGCYQRKVDIYDAAKMLIGGDYHRDAVDNLDINKIKFYSTWEDIVRDYPKCERDYSFV